MLNVALSLLGAPRGVMGAATWDEGVTPLTAGVRYPVYAAAGPDGRIYAVGANDPTKGDNSAIAAFTPGSPGSPGTWTAVAPMQRNHEHPAAARGADGRIYVISEGVMGGMEAYDTGCGSWTERRPFPDDRTELALSTGPSGIVTGPASILALGGALHGQAATNTVYAYRADTDGWTVLPPMPTPRAGLSAVTGPDGTVYAIGGGEVGSQSAPDQTLPLATVEAFNPTTGLWTELPPLTTPRYRPAAAFGGDGRIYVMGGNRVGPYSAAGELSSVEAYTPGDTHWSYVPSMARARQSHGAAQGADGRIYAIGGVELKESAFPAPLTSVEAYSAGPAVDKVTRPACATASPPADPDTLKAHFAPNSWTDVAPMPTPRKGLAAVTGPDGLIYALGGSVSDLRGAGTTIVEAYDPLANRWAPEPPMSEGRYGLAATLGPDGLIYAIGGGPRSIERYNVYTKRWQSDGLAQLPGSLYDLGAATGENGLLYEMGGYECDRTTQYVCPPTEAVRAYDPRTNGAWRDVAPKPNNSGGDDLFGTATGGDQLVYAIGGANPAGSGPSTGTATVATFDPRSESWNQAVGPMVAPREGLAATSTSDGRIMATGGSGSDPGQPLASVETLVGCANRWEPLASMHEARMQHAAATAVGPDGRAHVYAIGGVTTNLENPASPVPTGAAEAYTPRDAPITAPPGCSSVGISDAPAVNRDGSRTEFATFTVSIAPAPPTRNASVTFATEDGTAVAGRDYEQTTGVLNFPIGTTSRTIIVPIDPTTRASPSSQFHVDLSNPVGVYLGNSRATGTILASADIPYSGPSLGIGDVSVTRTHATVVPATFTVTLSGPPPTQRVTVDYVTRAGQGPGGAVEGTDYQFTQGTLDFEPGDPPSQQIRVGVIGSAEMGGPDKTFSMILGSPINASISRGVGTGTISDALDGLSIGDSAVVEPTSGSVPADFSVTLSDALDYPVTVRYASRNSSATAGRDYRATSGTLTFQPGDQEHVVEVPVLADPTPDGKEQFYITLIQPAGTVLSTRSIGTGTILEHDVGWAVPGAAATPGTPGYLIPGQPLPLLHSVVTTHAYQPALQPQTQAQQQFQSQQQTQSQVQIQVQPGLMLERQRQIQLQKEGLDGRQLLASGVPAALVVAFTGLGLLITRRCNDARAECEALRNGGRHRAAAPHRALTRRFDRRFR